MRLYLIYLLTFILAFSLSIYLTPLMRKAALQFNIVDRPDGRLKNQRSPVPYLGGLAVYLAFLISLSLTFSFDQEMLGILLGGTIIVILGLIDDFGVLSPVVKLCGQSIAVLVLMRSGIIIQLDIIPWYISLPLSYVWLIGIINALNIIDVMDGLSSGVALMCSIIFILVGVLNHSMIIAIVAAALGGSLLGFLRYNFEPAQIYLGDTGSMFIGMMMGSLAMIGNFTQHNNLGCFAPVLILGVPIFDTMFVMYIRYRRGMSILTGSPDHFALRLRKWRLTTRQTVTISYAISLILGIAALVIMNVRDGLALTILLMLIAAGIGTGYFLKKIDMTL